MSNHPNRKQIRVPARLINELAGTLERTLESARLIDPEANKLIDEARGRVRIIGRKNREMNSG